MYELRGLEKESLAFSKLNRLQILFNHIHIPIVINQTR